MSMIVVAAGGATGSVLRWLFSVAFNGPGWPWGTIAVNVLGSAVMGALAGHGLSGQARLFWMTGVLGGFTTFSAFSLEAATLWERGWMDGAAYVGLTLVLGLGAFALAYGMTRS
ncbi:fluoride efflux transporter FluC [Roseococcus sp. YIM B11640]|uniref:fluoride efflux transporter FluC n=1 Tax=Roseococcus sp. YIM B11640 TaxID=3133973 RepID=UPI003C7DF8BC